MKVCFISPLGYGLYAQDGGYPFGGAELQFYLLSGELAEDSNFRVTVLTTVNGSPTTERRGAITLIARRGRARLTVPSHLTWLAWCLAVSNYGVAFLKMWNLLRHIDADVYLHAGAGVEVGAYAMICRLLRRRFVYVVASSADVEGSYDKVRGPLRRLYPMGVRLADAVVCRTREQQSWLRARYRRAGVLIRTAHPARAAPSRDKSTVLWVGRAHPLKQPLMFLDLAHRLPSEPFVMIIMDDPHHNGLLKAIRDRAATLANLTLHENVGRDRIADFFERAKLFVNTSTYEGFPNTFVEAAMHGAPILSWTVNPDGVLGRHRIGLCAGGSFDQLAASAGELCASEVRREELGSRAAAYALEHHNLTRCAGELKALLNSLVP